jgi:hypothetical protein
VPTPDLDDDALRRLLADEPAEMLIDRAWLAGGDVPEDAQRWHSLRARLAATARPSFPLSGRDALALGAKPGPAIGRALAAVRAWWMAGGCRADRAACLSELARRLPA